jgi:hypothetical protein
MPPFLSWPDTVPETFPAAGPAAGHDTTPPTICQVSDAHHVRAHGPLTAQALTAHRHIHPRTTQAHTIPTLTPYVHTHADTNSHRHPHRHSPHPRKYTHHTTPTTTHTECVNTHYNPAAHTPLRTSAPALPSAGLPPSRRHLHIYHPTQTNICIHPDIPPYTHTAPSRLTPNYYPTNPTPLRTAGHLAHISSSGCGEYRYGINGNVGGNERDTEIGLVLVRVLSRLS